MRARQHRQGRVGLRGRLRRPPGSSIRRRRVAIAGALAAVGAFAAGIAIASHEGESGVGALPAGPELAALTAKGSAPSSHGRFTSWPESTKGAVQQLAEATSARARDLFVEDLRDEIADVRRHGGTPIALVEQRTPARSRPGGERVVRLDLETEFGSPRVLAVVGQDGAWVEVMTAELDNGETAWVHAGALDIGGTDFAMRVDLSERRLEVRRNGRLLRRIPVAVGGPATPTPTGRFAVTDKLEVPGGSAAYGCCALALTGHQPNVPQEWAGGDRLAVHATYHTETIGNEASLGCLRASETHARWLLHTVSLGTVVEVVE